MTVDCPRRGSHNTRANNCICAGLTNFNWKGLPSRSRTVEHLALFDSIGGDGVYPIAPVVVERSVCRQMPSPDFCELNEDLVKLQLQQNRCAAPSPPRILCFYGLRGDQWRSAPKSLVDMSLVCAPTARPRSGATKIRPSPLPREGGQGKSKLESSRGGDKSRAEAKHAGNP